MTIEQEKGVWYIVDGSVFKIGPFLTFLDAYTILNRLNFNRKALP